MRKRTNREQHTIESDSVRFPLDLKAEMGRFRRDLLANLVLNKLLSLLHFKDTLWGAIGATTALAFVLYLMTTLLSLAFNHSAPMPLYSALASILTATSFGIIKVLHDGIFTEGSLPLTLPDLVLKEAKAGELAEWFHSFLSVRKQLTVSLMFALFSIPTLLCFQAYTSARFKAGSYVIAFLCQFAVGHGAYCATQIPTLLKAISHQKMKLFWLSPANTAWIKQASWIFTKLSLADSFIAAFGLIGLYLLRPAESKITAAVALLWLITALVTILYTFVYPHHYLNRIIRIEKKCHVVSMQDLITSHSSELRNMTGDDLKQYLELIKLYRLLESARETAIDFRAWSGLIPSIAIPTLSYFGKGLLEIGKRIIFH